MTRRHPLWSEDLKAFYSLGRLCEVWVRRQLSSFGRERYTILIVRNIFEDR